MKDCQNTEDRSSSCDCQNTAIVVGEFAAELRPYIHPRIVIYNVFLGSATISLVCFVEMVGLVSTHLLTPHIG